MSNNLCCICGHKPSIHSDKGLGHCYYPGCGCTALWVHGKPEPPKPHLNDPIVPRVKLEPMPEKVLDKETKALNERNFTPATEKSFLLEKHQVTLTRWQRFMHWIDSWLP